MRVNYLELAGFRGFRQRTRLDVPRGFLVISGRNGSGKSTVIDAIEFALTGTIDKYASETGGKESVRDYLWWRGMGTAEGHFVRIGLVDEDGRQLDVVRSRESGLSIDGEKLESHLCDQELKPPQALLHMCRTSILRDELIAKLSWDQTDTARFEFVRSALGALAPRDVGGGVAGAISFAERTRVQLQQDAEFAARRLHVVLADVSEARAEAGRATDLELALAKIRGIIGHRDSVAELLSATRAYLAERRAALEAIGGLPEQLRGLEELRESVESQSFQMGLRRTDTRLEAAKETHDAARQRLIDTETQLASEEGANSVAASLAALAEHGERLGLHDGRCPLCSAFRTQEEFRRGVESLKARVSSMRASLAEARVEVAARRREEEVARAELEEAQAEYDRLMQLPQKLEQTQSAAFEKWRRFSTDPILPNSRGIERQVAIEQERLRELERHVYVLEASQAIDRLARLESSAATAQAEAETASARLAAADAAIVNLREAERTIRRVNGEIVDERLASISPLLTELYYRLRPHRNWRSIDYMIRGDVRRFLSLRVGEGLNPQFVFSSGERRAAGLAFLLAVSLSRPWCRWRTLILDDPIQHIDDFRALHLVEVLSALRKVDRQIICAVEDPQLADLLCRRLTSTAEEPGARVELDCDANGARATGWSRILPLPSAAVLSA
jgi:DNA repair exonuclease SbcCD ATPase subunit